MAVDTESRVGPLGYWTGCYRKYATFSGRARRAEYWWYTLFNLIVYAVIVTVGILISNGGENTAVFGVLIGAYLLGTFLPTLAVTCRRLHDSGLSGAWQLLGLVPLLGIVVLIMTILPSNSGPNKYGPEPR